MPKGKKGKGKKPTTTVKRPLLTIEAGDEAQDYAQITDKLGNGHFRCLCLQDGEIRLGTIRGKIRRLSHHMNQGDYVIISYRDFQDDKVDILHLFKHEEVRELRKKGLIPDDQNDEEDGTEAFIFARDDEKLNSEEDELENMIQNI